MLRILIVQTQFQNLSIPTKKSQMENAFKTEVRVVMQVFHIFNNN